MLGLRDGDVPQTISTSYSDDEQTCKNKLLRFFPTILRCRPEFRIIALTSASFLVPKDYATRVCKEFCLLGESYFIIQLSGAGDLFDACRVQAPVAYQSSSPQVISV